MHPTNQSPLPFCREIGRSGFVQADENAGASFLAMTRSEIEQQYGPEFFNIHKGLVSFLNKEKMFRVYMGNAYRGTYDIEAVRISDGRGFLDFILQLHSKSEWITGQHFKDLFDCIEAWTHQEFGIPPQQFFDVCHAMSQDAGDVNISAFVDGEWKEDP
jgi:hypothetical protein